MADKKFLFPVSRKPFFLQFSFKMQRYGMVRNIADELRYSDILSNLHRSVV